NARHTACDAGALDDEMRLANTCRALILQTKTDELLSRGLALENAQAPLADEERLVHANRPAGADLERIREAVSVLPDDDVAFFEPQHALCFHTERPNTEALPRFQQRVPYGRSIVRG